MPVIQCLLFVLCVAPFGADVPDDFPPLPNFERRVDYVAWYEEESTRDGTTPAYAAYARFMPELVGGDVAKEDWPDFAGMLTGATPTPTGFAGAQPTDRIAWPGPAPWFPDRKPEWEDAYQRTKAVLKQFTSASKKGPLVTPSGLQTGADNSSGLLKNMRLAHLEYIRQCARGRLESAWRMNDGKVSTKRFISAISANLRTANQLRDSMFIVEQSSALEIRYETYTHLRWAFAHGVLAEKDAAKIVKVLRKLDKDPIDASNTLKGQCALWLDALQYVYGPVAGGGLKLNGNRYREVTGQSMGVTNRFALGARIESDPKGAAKAILEGHADIRQHMRPGYDPEHHHAIPTLADRMRDFNKVTRGLMLMVGSEYGRIYIESARCEAHRRATRLVAELFAHKARKGEWPAKLSKLGKKTPKKTRRDAFRKKSFVYRLRDDGPLLYSVGQDGEDDNGQHDPHWGAGRRGGDFVFWPLPESEELLAASRLNRVAEKKLTPLSAIDADLMGKTVTLAAEVTETSSRPSKKHGHRYSLILTAGDASIELFYYQDIADRLSVNQKQIKSGVKIRARAEVAESDEGPALRLTAPLNIAVEE